MRLRKIYVRTNGSDVFFSERNSFEDLNFTFVSFSFSETLHHISFYIAPRFKEYHNLTKDAKTSSFVMDRFTIEL